MVLVIRKFDEFSRLLSENGFEVVNFPTIETVAVSDFSEIDAEIAAIENYDGVFLTSSAATEIFLARFGQNRRFSGKIYALGQRTAKLLAKTDFDVFFEQKANTAKDLLALISPEELQNKCFLFPCGDRSLRVVPEILAEIASVKEVVVYQTIKPEIKRELLDEIKGKLTNNEIRIVCFFSPSGIENFLEIFGEKISSKIKIAAIGETTAQFGREKNLNVEFISARTNAADFAVELIKFLEAV
jgi:uroporphyrinogen-III synthase